MKYLLSILLISYLTACGGQSSEEGLIPNQGGIGSDLPTEEPTTIPDVTQTTQPVTSPTPTISSSPTPVETQVPTPVVTPTPVITPAPVVTPTPVAPTPVEPIPEPTVTAVPVVEVPSITSFKLVAKMEGDTDFVDVSAISDGDVINLAILHYDLINIVAESEDDSMTGSVHFDLDGATSLDRVENQSIYTAATESTNLNISAGEPALGDYSLSVTPYELPDASGLAGATETLSFKVVWEETSSSPEPVESNVPAITSAVLAQYDDSSLEYEELAVLSDGVELDLINYSSMFVNVIAESSNPSDTGSVDFQLTGPLSIDRYENTHIYTMARESVNIDIDAGELIVGSYTLTITPYELVDKAGEVGSAYVINFTVVDTTPVGVEPTPTPTPTPTSTPVASVVAISDSYSLEADSTLETGIVSGVASNDTFFEASSFFSTFSEPSYGVLEMDLDGSFTYTPDTGFTGIDSFVYQLQDGDTTVQATASIRVYSMNDNGTFTAFTPSVDSKVVYVSSSEGSDSNSCLSTLAPCKTITEAIEKMRSGAPDHLLLKRGDTWRVAHRSLDELPSGRSASEPMVFSYYGDSGARPVIEGDQEVYRQDKNAVKHIRFVGLHFYGYKKDPNNAEFNASGGSPNLRFIGDFEDIQFEDNKFEFTAMTIQQYDGSRPQDFVLRRNIFSGAYSNESSYSRDGRAALLFAYGIDGLLIEENVFDYGGWHPTVKGAGANMLSHNIYLQYDSDGDQTVYKNNINTRAASHGLQMRSGGLAEDNFFGRNTIGLLLGYNYGGREIPSGVRAYALNNVFSEGLSMFKGVDACTADNVCSRALWGYEMTVNSDADYQSHGNIVSSLSPDNYAPEGTNLVVRSVSEIFDNGRTTYPQSGNITYKFVDNEGVTEGYSDPGRTLGDYNASLGGSNSFDGFMNTVTNRGLGEWDSRYEAKSINEFIRAGYTKN